MKNPFKRTEPVVSLIHVEGTYKVVVLSDKVIIDGKEFERGEELPEGVIVIWS